MVKGTLPIPYSRVDKEHCLYCRVGSIRGALPIPQSRVDKGVLPIP